MAFSYALSVGSGGWVRWELIEPPIDGYVRLQDEGGRLVIAELYMPRAAAAGELARIPFAAIEARLNDPHELIAQSVRWSLDIPGPLLSVAASYYGSTVHGTQGWVSDMLRSQHPHWGVEPVRRKRLPKLIPDDDRDVDARLVPPDSKPWPDEFYERVAEVYSALAARYRDPNGRIADASGVDIKRVEQWVRRARALGYLSPARPGKRG
jgi:hypothetical protein